MQRVGLIFGLVLFLLGIVAVVHPTFEYGTRERVAKFGPVVATLDEPKTFQVPGVLNLLRLSDNVLFWTVT